MTMSIDSSPDVEIELHDQRLERRRRWAVLFGVAGIVFASLLAGWFASFVSLFFAGEWMEVFNGWVGSSDDILWPGMWTLSILAAAAGILAIGLGVAGISKIRRETLSLAVVGIMLGLATFAIMGYVWWKTEDVMRSIIVFGVP